MNKKFISFFSMLAGAVFASAESFTFNVTVTNESKVAREAEPVAVKLNSVDGLNFVVKNASITCDGKAVASQLDDMDGNFMNDELFWVTDLKGKESKTFKVVVDDAEAAANTASPKIWTALQIRDKKDLHPNVLKVEAPASSNIYNDIYMHGITLESDLVGFRIYFDERQNIDLYGKKKRQLEIATTQFYTTAEQLAEGYGTDALWAGKAIGCGSFKKYVNGEPTNWTGDEQKIRGERIVTTGPLRTVVDVYDLGVSNGAALYNVHQYYSLVAGHRDMKVDVLFENDAKGQQFCTGVQKVGVTAEDSVRMGHKSEGILREDGIVASWGCDYPDMGKKQLWAPEAIGMAVYMPKQYIKSKAESELNYIYVVEPVNNELHYWTGFCCAKEEVGYKNAKEWFDSMKEWKEKCDKPVVVKVVPIQ